MHNDLDLPGTSLSLAMNWLDPTCSLFLFLAFPQPLHTQHVLFLLADSIYLNPRQHLKSKFHPFFSFIETSCKTKGNLEFLFCIYSIVRADTCHMYMNCVPGVHHRRMGRDGIAALPYPAPDPATPMRWLELSQTLQLGPSSPEEKHIQHCTLLARKISYP